MDPDSTFTIPHDGTSGADLSIIFEGDEEISRNLTFVDENACDSEIHSRSVRQTPNDQHYQVRTSTSGDDRCQAEPNPTRANSVSTGTDQDISFARMEDVAMNNWGRNDIRSGQTSGSDGSVSIHELYENVQAFHVDSNSEVDASSDEAFIAQAKLNSEEGYNGETVCNAPSSVYSESFLGRTDVFRPMLSNEQRKMLGLGSIPVTPVISSTPSSKASRAFTVDPNTPVSSASLCGVGGGGDADQKCTQTETAEECSFLMQNLHVGGTAVAHSDTESMGPMMEGKNASDSETFPARRRSNKKRVSFSDCEDITKSRSFQNPRPWFGSMPVSRYRYKLPRSIGTECKSRNYFPSPLSTLKRKSLLSSSHNSKINIPVPITMYLGSVDDGVSSSKKNANEKDSDHDSTSCPSNSENQDPITLTFSDGGSPIFRKNQELKGLTSLSPQTLKSKKLETNMQRQVRGALFDYESQWASEDVKFRRKVKHLELEYENKFLSVVQSHNVLQEKLYEKLLRRIQKIEKQVKKEALQGRLKEGNCFHITHDIGNIKLGN